MREEPPRRPRRLLLGEDAGLLGADLLEEGVSFEEGGPPEEDVSFEEDGPPEEALFFAAELAFASPLALASPLASASPLERPVERPPPRRPRVRR